MYINFAGYLGFLLIMLRMTGMLVFNPIFGRRNVPILANAGLAFVLAILLVGIVPTPTGPEPTLVGFIYLVFKEMAIGMVAGFILQLFMSVLIIGGEVIDMQMGTSMSKAFDPGSNSSISLSSNFFNIMFILAFFITNNHLTFISMLAQSFRVIPVGDIQLTPQMLYYIPELFSSVLIFAVKLCIPVAVVEIVVTVAVGIIMRVIPQINVFVVNIQLKLFIGLIALVILVPSCTAFFENLIVISFERIETAWLLFI